MDIYIFSSTTLENIRRGIEKCVWALASINDEHEQARRTRASMMPIPSAGLFYCSDPQVFTTPFVIESAPDNREISDVWNEVWYLPFRIRPIGELKNRVAWNRACARWRFLRDSDNRGGLVTPARAFAPIRILRTEWDDMLTDLSVDPEQYEELF